MHFTLQSAKALTGAFEISAEVTGNGVAELILFGNSIGFDNELRLSLDGVSCIFKIGGGTLRTVTLNRQMDVSKLNTVTLKRDGSDVCSILINGIAQSTTSVNSGTFLLNRIGAAFTTKFHGGVISNPYIYDIDNPTNSESWKLDKQFPIVTEQSSSGANLLTYVNSDALTREIFKLNFDRTQWDGRLGGTIVVAR
jgi:hypothetical protein